MPSKVAATASQTKYQTWLPGTWLELTKPNIKHGAQVRGESLPNQISTLHTGKRRELTKPNIKQIAQVHGES
jgi:hypothetical protein